jgi:hypothetical protein
VDGDHVGQVAGRAGQPNVCAPEDTIPKTETKDGQASLDLEGLLIERDTSIAGFGQDHVAELAG